MHVRVCVRRTFEHVKQTANLGASVALLYASEAIPGQGIVRMDLATPPGLLNVPNNQLVWPEHVSAHEESIQYAEQRL